jgi:hypothetical protein
MPAFHDAGPILPPRQCPCCSRAARSSREAPHVELLNSYSYVAQSAMRGVQITAATAVAVVRWERSHALDVLSMRMADVRREAEWTGVSTATELDRHRAAPVDPERQSGAATG